jgi:uncharacterized protein (TIRG00374 family)
MANPKSPIARPVSRIVSLVGLAVFVGLVVWGGQDALERVRASDPFFLFLAFAATGVWTLVGALRWQTWCNALAGRKVCSTRRYYSIFIAAAAISQIVPPAIGNLGGRPVIYSLTTGESLPRAFVASLLDNICDVAVFMLMAIPAALGLWGVISYSTSLSIMLGLVLVGLAALRLARGRGMTMLKALGQVANWVGGVPVVGPRLAGALQHIGRSTLPTPGATERIFLYSVLLYSLSMTRQVMMMEAMRLDLPWAPFMLALPVAHMILLVGITPSALGIFEASWTGVLAWAGLSIEQGVSFVVGRRLYMTAFVPLWTILGLFADIVPFQVYQRHINGSPGGGRAMPREALTPDTSSPQATE